MKNQGGDRMFCPFCGRACEYHTCVFWAQAETEGGACLLATFIECAIEIMQDYLEEQISEEE